MPSSTSSLSLSSLPVGARVAGLGVLGCAVVGLLHLDHLPWTVCFFKAATGLPCPACGTTRALGRFFALDVAGALSMNPLAALGFMALLAWGLADAAARACGRKLSFQLSPDAKRVLTVTAVVLLAVNWAYLISVAR